MFSMNDCKKLFDSLFVNLLGISTQKDCKLNLASIDMKFAQHCLHRTHSKLPLSLPASKAHLVKAFFLRILQAGISAAPTRALSAVKNMNLPQQLKDIKLPELPQAIKDLKL